MTPIIAPAAGPGATPRPAIGTCADYNTRMEPPATLSDPAPATASAPHASAGAARPRELTLVLGGARSGKSHFAEQLATEYATATGGSVTYVATAREDASDEEMVARIALHRARRPAGWGLVEEPVHLADALYGHAHHHGCIVVDCVTLWLNNLLFPDGRAYPEHGLITPPATYPEETEALLAALPTMPGHIILVSNEIGLGVVPMGAVTRFYVDELGRLNQKLAALADRVRLLVAGIPVKVKGNDPTW
jgi:adenosylcobinamide kinase/adenosylcobinamide-phosphate guanylyltransferase